MRFAILGSRGFPSSYGGYETLVRHLAPHLVRSGHDVTVYCRARHDGQRIWTTDAVRCIATPGRNTKSLSTLTFGATSVLDASFRRFDSILILNIANGFWLPLLRATGTPFAVNTDGIEWERGKWSRLGQATFRAGAWLTARMADELVCDSEAIGEIWQTRFRRTSTYIPYGAPILSDTERDRLEPLDLENRPYVLVVARLVPENNVDLTLDALELLGDQAPYAVIVGGANGHSATETRLRAMQAKAHIIWLGHVDDQRLLNQLWAHSAIYVHGHSAGGTNPALLQALGAGAPTLVLDTPFNAEVLPFREHWFSRNPQELANRIHSIMESRSLRETMAQRGQAIARERYDWGKVCKAYEEMMLRLGRM